MKLKELTETEYLAMIWGLLALGAVSTVLRFIVRWTTQRRFYKDDWLALTSWVSLLILAALYTGSSHSVFFLSNYAKTFFLTGIPPTVDLDELIHANKVFGIVQLVAMLFFWTTLWAGKLSLLAFYKRLMEGVSGYLRWWWAVVIINILTYLGCFLSNFLTCMPLERRWSPDPLTNCSTPDGIASIIDAIKFASAVDIATDLLIMFLPIPLIWGLRIPFLQKIGLAVIFGLGTIVIAFAIFRLRAVTDSIGVVSYTAAQDLATWSMLECSVAVVVISLPALRGLLASKVCRTRTGGSYSGAIKGQLRGSGNTSGNGTGATAGSHAHGGHIRLDDISLDKPNRDNDNSSSQEELRRTYSAEEHTHEGPGINMTREGFVSSTAGGPAQTTGAGPHCAV